MGIRMKAFAAGFGAYELAKHARIKYKGKGKNGRRFSYRGTKK
jgi:hypothetical protein